MNAKRNRFCLVLLLGAATIVLLPKLALCQEGFQDEQLRSFLAEGAGLIKLRIQLSDETGKVDSLEQKLKQEDIDIKKQSEHEEENVKIFQGFSKRVKNEVEQFNVYCKGKFPKGEYEKRKAWCDENEVRLAAEQTQAREVGNAIVGRLRSVEDRKKKLSEETLNWFKRKKELNGQWEDWKTAQQNWLERVKGPAMSGLIADLRERAGASLGCENALTVEEAHRCLQLLWERVEKRKEPIRKGGSGNVR